MGSVWRVEKSEPHGTLLERVRKLLAMAEGDGVTQAEAEAFTEKAAGLMARYGIDRALLAAARPDTDRPARSRHRRTQAVGGRPLAPAGRAGHRDALPVRAAAAPGPASKVHVFGYGSDLERVEMLYTSLLVQMAHGLAEAAVPATARSVRAWRRSWLLGYTSAVIARVRGAEERAASAAGTARNGDGPSTALVLADRSLVVRRQLRAGLSEPAQAADHLLGQRLQLGVRGGRARRHRRLSGCRAAVPWPDGPMPLATSSRRFRAPMIAAALRARPMT